ncbi:MAG: SIS domain-containing protein [bacterium]|nr:SIS domain-containing protein [bacterium]
MCGIVAFVGNEKWKENAELSWIENIIKEIEICDNVELEFVDRLLKNLENHFDDISSFGLYFELINESGAGEKIETLVRLLKDVQEKFSAHRTDDAPDNEQKLIEMLKDYIWQLERELMGSVERTATLFPEHLEQAEFKRSFHFVAWSIKQVLENIDRLEIRGRDSAGISIQCLLSEAIDLDTLFDAENREEYKSRIAIDNFNNLNIGSQVQPDGSFLLGFTYKAANLVGRLGDNTENLRRFICEDKLLWTIAAYIEHISIIAHTRWASNGIINMTNCHPVNAFVEGNINGNNNADKDVIFALNGDVDNYSEMVEEAVHSQGYTINPLVSTDVKILPVFYRFNTPFGEVPEKRLAMTMSHAEGSLAVSMLHPLHPYKLFLALKGSGQSLFAGRAKDGLIVASEVYGLCSRTRKSYPLSGLKNGGTVVTFDVKVAEDKQMNARYLGLNKEIEIQPEAIEIYARDIVREPYEYYFEKEIRQSVFSIRNTIRGKYKKSKKHIEFLFKNNESLRILLSRLRNPQLKRVGRITVIGQGTAAVAAMGIAYLIRKALKNSRVIVASIESPELSGFQSEDNMDDMLIIPVSQSGTTADTNRAVDIARSKGAWIHAIVNRRNSPLIRKCDSYLYTSDGRDVEMAVASTKAFYAQICAGKLMAMFFAREFKSLTPEEIYEEILILEELPVKVGQVLGQADNIAAIAEKHAPTRHNWAIVGNGPNKIAGKEIRIKLSELCYKSIPFDITEDKKHIDLSSEPLTIVVANDLHDSLIRDTIKEISIFKAHQGKPIVFCSQDEAGFREYAEEVIVLPHIGGDLGFVLATVAGHLWGFYAAKAIDRQREPMQKIRGLLTDYLEHPQTWDANSILKQFYGVLDNAKDGKLDAAVPASGIAALVDYVLSVRKVTNTSENLKQTIKDGLEVVNALINETTRTIDTIRHQAKTVTVGTSRLGSQLTAMLQAAFDELSISINQLIAEDVEFLHVLAPILAGIEGGMLFDSSHKENSDPGSLEVSILKVSERFGCSIGVPSSYETPHVAVGLKRKALRLQRAFLSTGSKGDENMLIIPLFAPESLELNKIALLHLHFVKQTSTKRKLALLKVLKKSDDFIEFLEETRNTARKQDILEKTSPYELVYTPIRKIINNYVK